MRETLSGLGLAALTCIGLILLPDAQARDLAAVLLTLIAAVYLGFAIASQGRLSVGRQIAGAAIFVFFALLGLWLNWWFLAAGLALHGGWDLLHHGEGGSGVIPRWYVPFCAVYDFAVAIFIAVYFAVS